MSEKRGLRAFRIEDSLWKRARRKSAQEGTSVSAILRQALRNYVRKSGKESEKDAK